MIDLIKPKNIKVTDLDGVEIDVTISRYPALEGANLFIENIKTLFKGDTNEAILKVMKYVEINNRRLINQDVINELVPDRHALAKILFEMESYNGGLGREKLLSFISQSINQVQGTSASILTQVLQRFLVKK